MPLPLPNLDTRRWSDLVDEGRALLPRYAPDWTDHNAHDPGITLMELFAWLAEMDIYRLNQIPPRHRLKFLELVGYVPQPPVAARTMLTFSPTSGAAFTVPSDAQFASLAGPVFRTLHGLDVAVAPLKAILIDAGDGVLRDHTGELLQGIPVKTFGAAIYLGFDALPANTHLTLGIRVECCNNSDRERRRILGELELEAEACRSTLLHHHCHGNPPAPPPKPELKHHSVKLAWEAWTGAWTPVVAISDDTRALTLDGIVDLPIPAGVAKTALGTPPLKPYFYLRCRLAAGTYDRVPLLVDVAPNSVWSEQSVPAVQTFPVAAGVVASGVVPAPGNLAGLEFDMDGGGVIHSLKFLAAGTANHPDIAVLSYVPPTVLVSGLLTLSLAHAAASNGTPFQRMFLSGAPLVQRSLHLYTHQSGQWHRWHRRNDLESSRRTDYHFSLDAPGGAITFGDGEHGRVPPLNATVVAFYEQTDAANGNLPAREISSVAVSDWNTVLVPTALANMLAGIVTNRAASTGGSAQEDIQASAGHAVEILHAHERLVELAERYGSTTLDQIPRDAVRAIKAPTRAVNLLDIERLALDTPGTCIARARAWAGVDANYPCLRASGVVTVIIVPDLDTPKPLPSAGLLRAVQRYLDLRRIVCTRIIVAPPEYLTITVTAKLGLIRGSSPTRVRADVRAALDTFLDPRIGGPAGFGWPFGRDIYRSEVLQVVQSVPGVDYVADLSLQSDKAGPQCGNIAVCAAWLVTPGKHRIDIV